MKNEEKRYARVGEKGKKKDWGGAGWGVGTPQICLGTKSEPAFESVGLKEEADLAVKAVKWFYGLTVADATDSAAPEGAKLSSPPSMVLIKIYLPPSFTSQINNNTAGEEGGI